MHLIIEQLRLAPQDAPPHGLHLCIFCKAEEALSCGLH